MRDDSGNVIAEFVGVVVGLMIPVMFIATSCWSFVETDLALRAAAESMARTYVVSPNQSVAQQRSRAVLRVVLKDHGIPTSQVTSKVSCSASPCLTAGSAITVTLKRKTSVTVPGFGIRALNQTQSHTAIVDEVR
jgi:Flp pilus assembly protein TadG